MGSRFRLRKPEIVQASFRRRLCPPLEFQERGLDRCTMIVLHQYMYVFLIVLVFTSVNYYIEQSARKISLRLRRIPPFIWNRIVLSGFKQSRRKCCCGTLPTNRRGHLQSLHQKLLSTLLVWSANRWNLFFLRNRERLIRCCEFSTDWTLHRILDIMT